MSRDNDDGVLIDVDPEFLDKKKTDDGDFPDLEVKVETAKKDDADETVKVDDPKNADDESPEDLRKRLKEAQDEANRHRQEASRLRNEHKDLSEKSQSAAYAAAQSEYDTVNTRLHHAGKERAALKEKLALHQSLGDYESAADAQTELTKLAVREMADQQRKAQIESNYERQRQEAQRQPARNDFESQIEGLSEPTQRWLRNHPECVTDAKLNARVRAAHFDAMDQGMDVDSPKYFQFVEEKLGFREAPKIDPKPEPRVEPKNDARTTSPPISRSGGGSVKSPNQVRLTAAEVEAARDLGMSNSEYASWKLKCERDGKYKTYEVRR